MVLPQEILHTVSSILEHVFVSTRAVKNVRKDEPDFVFDMGAVEDVHIPNVTRERETIDSVQHTEAESDVLRMDVSSQRWAGPTDVLLMEEGKGVQLKNVTNVPNLVPTFALVTVEGNGA